MSKSKYCTFYSYLIEEIQRRGLHVRKSLLSEDGYWTIGICFRSKKSGKIRFYRFTYDNHGDKFNIEKRKFFSYEPIRQMQVSVSDNLKEISKQALEIASSTS